MSGGVRATWLSQAQWPGDEGDPGMLSDSLYSMSRLSSEERDAGSCVNLHNSH